MTQQPFTVLRAEAFVRAAKGVALPFGRLQGRVALPGLLQVHAQAYPLRKRVDGRSLPARAPGGLTIQVHALPRKVPGRATTERGHPVGLCGSEGLRELKPPTMPSFISGDTQGPSIMVWARAPRGTVHGESPKLPHHPRVGAAA